MSLALAALCAWPVWRHFISHRTLYFDSVPAWPFGCLGLLTFGLVLAMHLGNLARRPTLTLSQGGLRFESFLRSQSWRWADITQFRQAREEASIIALNYAPNAPRNWYDKFGGAYDADGVIPGGWAMDPDKLVGLLTQAHARWASAPTQVRRTEVANDRFELRRSRTMPAIMFVTVIVICVLTLVTNPWDWIGLAAMAIIFAISSPYYYAAFWPDRLLVEPEGVTLVSLGILRRMGWRYGRFRVARGRSRLTDRIIFDSMTEDAWPRLVAISARFTGIGAIPAGWGVTPQHIVDLLNATRERWAGVMGDGGRDR